MHDLKSVLQTLDPTDQKRFESSLKTPNHGGGKAKALVRQYFAHPEIDSLERIIRLYGNSSKKSKDAFHALKKRVSGELMEFVVGEVRVEKVSRETEIAHCHEYAIYLFENQLFAWGGSTCLGRSNWQRSRRPITF